MVSGLCIVSTSWLGACFTKLRKKILVELINFRGNQQIVFWKAWNIWWFMDNFVFYLSKHHPSWALKCSVLHNECCDLGAPVGRQPHVKLSMERPANPGDLMCSARPADVSLSLREKITVAAARKQPALCIYLVTPFILNNLSFKKMRMVRIERYNLW